jgi:hypothetical protein
MPELDRIGLEEQFEIPVLEPVVVEHHEVVSVDTPAPSAQVPEIFDEEDDFDDLAEAEKVIKDNIDRANDLLDKVQTEITNGNFSARMVEVAGQLINSVTQAAKELMTNAHTKRQIILKDKVLMLKRREIDIRQLSSNTPKNQNLIVASREDVLKLLKE